MTYFNLRKRTPEPETEDVEEDVNEAWDEAEEDTRDAPEKAAPTSWREALWCGIRGPSTWLTLHTNREVSLIFHLFVGWAMSAGVWVAAGIVALWLFGVLAFIPRDYKDRVTARFEAWSKPPEAEPGETEPDAEESIPADPRTVLIGWLDDLTRGRSGIHLDELHQALTRHPELAALKRPQMRAWLDRHGVAVERTLRVGRVAGRSGVSRGTVDALLKALPPLVESDGPEPQVHASGLHGSPVERSVERGGEHAA
jgi:hypothetical protein